MTTRAALVSVLLAVAVAGCTPAPTSNLESQPAPSRTMASAVPVSDSQPPLAPTVSASKSTAPVAVWDELSFDQITTIGDQTAQARWAIKKGKVRIEMTMMGKGITLIGDPIKQIGYSWTQGQNQVTQIPYDQFEEQLGAVPDPLELASDAMQGTPAGVETVDGQACEVREIAGTAATLRIWVTRNNGFPIKSELAAPEGTITTLFKNIRHGNVPDSLFDPPVGMQIAPSY